MNKKKEIAFWIVIGVISLFVTAFTLFYYDLANGPLICFILQLVLIAAAITMRIILRHKKFVIRMIPTISFVVLSATLIVLTKPTIEPKSVAYYKNPERTKVLSLENGDVRGVLNEDRDVRIYAGIPYAKAPVGNLRWKEPQDVENWSGVKECDYFAPRSMQPASNPITSTLVDIYSAKGWHPDYLMHPEQNMSEDSLYLNIWRPNTDETDLPILVFIHGGSLTTGSSAYEDYNGEMMAKTGVIMITIQYRLGVFGYFAHQELENESEHHTTGNYGLLDQIKALEWINKNAHYFGGDKTKITIAGESAGSSSISALCSSPLANGLFRYAIGESSSLVVRKAPHTFREMDKAKETGANIMKEFNCSSIEELRKIPADKLVKTQYSNSEMTIDGYALEKHPYEVYQEGHNNESALLNGYNVLEADAFVVPQYLFNPTNKKNIKERLASSFGEDIANELMDVYKDRIEKDAFSVFNEIYSVYWFIQPHHSWSHMALANGEPVYRYQFTKENHFHTTYHAGEMIYAYGNVEKCEEKWKYNASDIALSKQMLAYWSNFAKYGNPNGEGLPTWDLYNETDNKVMELGEHVGPFDDRYKDVYPIIEKIIDQELEKEKRL